MLDGFFKVFGGKGRVAESDGAQEAGNKS